MSSFRIHLDMKWIEMIWMNVLQYSVVLYHTIVYTHSWTGNKLYSRYMAGDWTAVDHWYTESHAGSVRFLHVLFFHLFFYFVFFIAKIPRFISKTEKSILWEESWVSPFRIVFFRGFSWGFCCPKTNCPKTRGNRIIFVERHIYI